MKRQALLKALREAAQERGEELEFVRHGGRHDLYRVGNHQFPIARHADIPERTARKTIQEVRNL
ncbi:type II toxin-antitoxin system HicA family toxin [Nocardiopsis composta]|uniref:Ribosomal protein S12 methylthiotransferase accessory factor YcaO n=1 Tax=Nocardiopsis composta TaxID=157465 RepID=A0A7W8QTP1_9ACTN|nr:type II toxin-antitoxin system HicA family toxin [Nocardiopsis composta]MBB5436034.1 ribosomal protein S12 methylthiotransferase accessory factor YcaO [Nocardiopsis composta]